MEVTYITSHTVYELRSYVSQGRGAISNGEGDFSPFQIAVLGRGLRGAGTPSPLKENEIEGCLYGKWCHTWEQLSF